MQKALEAKGRQGKEWSQKATDETEALKASRRRQSKSEQSGSTPRLRKRAKMQQALRAVEASDEGQAQQKQAHGRVANREEIGQTRENHTPQLVIQHCDGTSTS